MFVNICVLNKANAKPEIIGKVSFDNDKVTFDCVDKEFLGVVKVNDKVYIPADGADYVRALPKYLHGDYIWASEVQDSTRRVVVKGA